MRNTEKRTLVMQFLQDPQWQGWSDRQIAAQCHVSREYVWRLRQHLTSNRSQVTYRTKHGTVTTMHTARMSQARCSPPPAPSLPLAGDSLVDAGVSPALAQRILARLNTMPPAQRRQAEQLLSKLLL
jgi:hypothetical protein